MVELDIRPHRHTASAERAWLGAFVAVEAVVLLLIVLDQVGRVLPGRLATQVSHNSESFVLAIVMSLAIA